ncbi:DUF1353 domain-containing protein [Blastococcus sp. SYSU D00813]
MPFTRGPNLYYPGAGQYVTDGVTEYEGRYGRLRIAQGFPTDLATVPRIFWALLPPQGVYERAAVLHDWLCVELARAHRDRRPPMVSSRDVDGLFRRVMRECGVGFATRWLMWLGVRLGAAANPVRRAGLLRDLPLMAAVAVPALLLVAAVLLGLGWLLALASPLY